MLLDVEYVATNKAGSVRVYQGEEEGAVTGDLLISLPQFALHAEYLQNARLTSSTLEAPSADSMGERTKEKKAKLWRVRKQV